MEETDRLVKDKKVEIENMNLKLKSLEADLKKCQEEHDEIENGKNQMDQYEKEMEHLVSAKKALRISTIVLMVLGVAGFAGIIAAAVNMAMNETEGAEGIIKFLSFLDGAVFDAGVLCLIFYFVDRTKYNNRYWAVDGLRSAIPHQEEQLAKDMEKLETSVNEISAAADAMNDECNGEAGLQNVLVKLNKFSRKISEIKNGKKTSEAIFKD